MTQDRRLLAVLLGILLATPGALLPQDAATPLPDARAFLEQVRQRLHSDEYLLDEYTFTERRTEKRFDAKGNVTEEKHEVYEVYPSARSRLTYRKLVARNGSPLPPDELAEQDRDHEKKVARAMAGGEAAEAKRQKRRLERARREQEIVDELFRMYDIAFQGREVLDGRSSLVVTFSPRPGAKPSNRAGKILQKFAGRAWVDEQDYQVVRAEAELLDTFSYGLGVFARLYKGATASFVRRKVNGEVWLPAYARFRGHARLLLVKGLRIDSESEYTDYRKFEVATDEKIEPEELPAAPGASR
ncbi:MAG: hypothetical protein ABR576_04370 [Thermoanaerobaculia bacterium]